MNVCCWRLLLGLTLLTGCLMPVRGGAATAPVAEAPVRPATVTNRLDWDARGGVVSASIHTWPVPKVLARIADATGWKVYMAPGIRETVVTRFSDRAPGEALARLLGGLNFALLPRTTNEPTRLFVFRSKADEATQLVRGTNDLATNRIPNELVVVLKPGEKIEDIARQLGAKVVGSIPELNAYRLQFTDEVATEEAREQLSNDPRVAELDSNYKFDRPPNGLQAAAGGGGGPRTVAPKQAVDGKYTVVAVIDTPVQINDPDLAGFLLQGINMAGPADLGGNAPTHGTAMVETLLKGLSVGADGDSAAVRILPIDVYGNQENTSSFQIAQGILAAAAYNPSVYNISSGAGGRNMILDQAVQYALNAGGNQPLFFASAGNAPTGQPVYPAAIPGVIGVTAGDAEGNRAAWANYGSFAPVMAPGTAYVTYGGLRYQVQGTSPASAYMAGFAAGMVDSRRSTAGIQQLILSSPSLRAR